MGWVDGSWVQGEAGVGKEPDDQVLVVADASDALFGGVGDLSQGGRGPIRQLDVLEVGPQVLDRIELGGVGRQPLGTRGTLTQSGRVWAGSGRIKGRRRGD